MTLPCEHRLMRQLCIECNCSIVSCKENNRVYKLQNDKNYKICKVKYDDVYCDTRNIDGCRADVLLFTCIEKNDRHKIAIIVELKGRDVRHAQKQIIQTLSREKNVLLEYVVVARVVPVSVPRALQNIPVFEKLLKNLEIHNRLLSTKISSRKLYIANNHYKDPELLSSVYESINWRN